MKSTYCEVNGEAREIFKAPKTDSGKNSAKGLIKVERVDGEYVAKYPVSWEEERQGCLETVFLNGVITKNLSLSNIRHRLTQNL